MPRECTCLRLARVVAVLGRGWGAGVVGTRLLQRAGASNLHAGCAISSVPHCGSYAAWFACGSPLAMASGCDSVSRMASSRDGGGGGGGGDGGGGVDGSGQPGLHWTPSASLDSAPPWRRHGSGDECRLCWDFVRVSAPSRAWPRNESRRRGCDVWTNPSGRVAWVTLAWDGCCAPREGVPCSALCCPWWRNPLVSTGLYPGPVAGQP